MAIDSYRFLDFASRQIMKAWAAREEPGAIPFTPLRKPLGECTVALVSPAAVARNDDVPFDQDGERRNPWWGDPSYRAIPFETLEGWRGWLALSLAGFPSLIGFFLPFSVLANRAIAQLPEGLSADYFAAGRNSLLLAGVTAAVTIVFAVFFGYAARVAKNAVTSGAARFASLGYALPGTVLAIGLFIPLAAFDNAIDGWMRQTFSFSTGLMLSGTLFAVTAALVIRFLAIAIGSIESGLARISPNLDAAGRALGASAFSIMLRVHLPMLVPALGAAALLVFVDAMKELPATLLLRPLGFDTLATHVYGLAAAERLEEATLGAVSIVLAGLLPVLLLHHTIAGGRTGARRGTGS